MEVLEKNAQLITRLSKELEELHQKLKETRLNLAKLETEIPTMKKNHEKVAKLAGMDLNGFQQDDVKEAEKILIDAINEYKKLQNDIKELEKSIEIVEEQFVYAESS